MTERNPESSWYHPERALKFLRTAPEPTIVGRAILETFTERGPLFANFLAPREHGVLICAFRGDAHYSTEVYRGLTLTTFTWFNAGISEPMLFLVPPRQNYFLKLRYPENCAGHELVALGWELPGEPHTFWTHG